MDSIGCTNLQDSIVLTANPSYMDIDRVAVDSQENSSSYWIPSSRTRENLSGKKKAFYTMPGVSVDNVKNDDVHGLLKKYCPHEISKLRSNQVEKILDLEPTVVNIEKLVENANFFAAVNVSSKFLTSIGQGVGAARQNHSVHNAESLRVWFLRLKSLILINQYNIACQELEPFEEFDAPDLYYEYYAEIYPGLRDLPRLMGKTDESITRYIKLMATVKKILDSNFNGTPYGSSFSTIWEERFIEIRKLAANCFYSIKDSHVALEMLHSLVERYDRVYERTKLEKLRLDKMRLISSMGRLCLQLGDRITGVEYFNDYELLRRSLPDDGGPELMIRSHLNSGYLHVFVGSHQEAIASFQQALDIDPKCLPAINNLAIGYLYCGQLNEGISIMEQFLTDNPGIAFDDQSFCINLCTLYELLNTQNCLDKKIRLLKLAAENGSETFACNRLKL